LRYHAPSAIIEPADARLFTSLATALLGGFALLAISVVLSAPHASLVEWRAVANQAAREYMLLALQILGLLVASFWMLGALRRRYPQWAPWKPSDLPPLADPDRVNRIGCLLLALAGACGTLALVNPAWLLEVFFGGRAPAPALQAFTYNPDFAHVRAPVLFSCIGLNLLLFVWVAIDGRWRELTRRIELGLTLSICAIMAWSVLAGDILQSQPADQLMKLAMALCSGFALSNAWSSRDRYWNDGGGFDAPQHPLVTNDGA
jgi:hypothetical protein